MNFKKIIFFRIALFSIFLSLLVLPISKSYAIDKAIMIFDASGSMIGNFLTDWNKDIELGLMGLAESVKEKIEETSNTLSELNGTK